jgi:DNA-binding CsgD family transcriptional regulator
VVPEFAEAAARTGDATALQAAVDWMAELTRVTRTGWALGLDARVRALNSEGEVADALYRESIQRLRETPIRTQLARSHLLYGEWLRREGRRVDARSQLRVAHSMLTAMGLAGFAERARRELVATGETVRKRTALTSAAARGLLTPQEAEVARLARDGLSNPEIGARLFISSRTVQYHLKKVFSKLEISSRGQLHRVLTLDSHIAPANSVRRGARS